MSLFTRISATLTSTVDKAVSRVENHDAIIEAALKDTNRSAARARVRLARVRKDGQSLIERQQTLTKNIATWRERARTTAPSNREKALACLKRAQLCESQLEGVNASLKKHEELESQVSSTLSQVESRLHEITQQRNMMRSRETVADAMRVINNIDGAATSDIEETFDRWEVLISESEINVSNGDSVTDFDALESGFIQEEESTTLNAELDALLAQDEDSDNV